jgi:hypothetical protein
MNYEHAGRKIRLPLTKKFVVHHISVLDAAPGVCHLNTDDDLLNGWTGAPVKRMKTLICELKGPTFSITGFRGRIRILRAQPS